MSSVTNTFMCVLPLWTMNVWPTNSGMIVQARAQVVIGSLMPDSFCRSTLPNSFASTYGPFLSERPMLSFQLVSCQLLAKSSTLADS